MFSELKAKTPILFDNYLATKTKSKTINGRFSKHKNFKVYLSIAKQRKIEFENPFEHYKIKKTEGQFQPLTKSELLDLWYYYNGIEIQGTNRKVMRAFLFACITGMRHSDVRIFTPEKIKGDFIVFTPYKTQ